MEDWIVNEKNLKDFHWVRGIQMGWTTDYWLVIKIPVFFTWDKCLKVDVMCLDLGHFF